MKLKIFIPASLLTLSLLAADSDIDPVAVSWTGAATNAQGEVMLQVAVNTTRAPDLADWCSHAGELCTEWYPKICALLDSEGFVPPKHLRIKFREQMPPGTPAATGGGVMSISADYIRHHTNDWGLVVHELTHVVQDYGRSQNPGWLVEGIADYVRLASFEPQARRPRLHPERDNYRAGYKVTAMFLEWIEKNHDPHFVHKINAAMRAGRYRPELFTELTGKPVDDLWADFIAASAKPA